ncbi:polyprenyl synthetase family protein [Salisediminibacterium halotolerans]|uniref:Farnesyl diphosphate synthase n=1 Tax=Salisediminibacterium halotolerans TaxID=517425 RepID=A0A1H9PGG6_9BACI|nr:farnesyl diphosphate synthase [Salisediminibacterium haloalkalitolerans]SER46949.1 geranylgeranyl diphosphate synthase, type II [Salisediminibacterium haloalkalitolerans]
MTNDPAGVQQFLSEQKKVLDQLLLEYARGTAAPSTVQESMVYSLNAGGKRIRPILLLAVLKGYGIPLQKGYRTAAAIEMIHTYSLIHDDLPAMDNDDLRRGKPTNHKVFGEAAAILAGDALLTASFQLLTDNQDLLPEQKMSTVKLIARAAGPSGMIYGQLLDMESEGKSLTIDELEWIHHRKTGDLLSVALESGAVIANAEQKDKEALSIFGKHLGLAFQIKDDLLDVEGDEAELGKPVGSDEVNEKSTYPQILGVKAAEDKLHFHLQEAKRCLAQLSMEPELLKGLTDYIGYRKS